MQPSDSKKINLPVLIAFRHIKQCECKLEEECSKAGRGRANEDSGEKKSELRGKKN